LHLHVLIGFNAKYGSREGAKPRRSDERRTILANTLLISTSTDDARALALPTWQPCGWWPGGLGSPAAAARSWAQEHAGGQQPEPKDEIILADKY